MLVSLAVVFISLCVLNHHLVHLEYTQFLFVKDTQELKNKYTPFFLCLELYSQEF